MESKHTPGPWSFYTKPQPNGCPIVGARGLMVAMVAHSIHHADQKDTAIANAELISAAPEMREAIDFLCGLHPEVTIDGPPMQIAQRIFDSVIAERSALLQRTKDLEKSLDYLRSSSFKEPTK